MDNKKDKSKKNRYATNEVGRKSKYERNVKPRLLEIAAWCRDGLTDKQIAANLGISQDSFYVYKNKHNEFAETLKETKEIADIKVENSLNKNANGYDYEEQTVVMKKEVIYKDGKRVKEVTYPEIITLTKHREAETRAQMFWLQNRKPEKWRNQSQVDLRVSKLEDILNEDNS